MTTSWTGIKVYECSAVISLRGNIQTMNQLLYERSRVFSVRKVSADHAMRLLAGRGIQVNREKTEIILQFLYLIAKTYNKQKEIVAGGLDLTNESNT